MAQNNAIFNSASEYDYPAGSLVMGPKEGDDEAWLIVEGIVRQYDVYPNGSEMTLNAYKPGAILSLTWLLGGAKNKYYFVAETDVLVRRIPAKQFVDHLRSNPNEALGILERLSKGLDGMFMRIYSNSYNEAKQRVMYHIRVAAERFGEPDGWGRPSVIFSIAQLAAATGMARETVSRTLTKLEEDRLIKRTGKKIVVLDSKKDPT